MSSPASDNTPLLRPLDAFTASELRQLVQRIESSGELGRSKVYVALLDYLVECSISDKSPKEYDIAIDVLGKGSDFDVSQDSAVRVYIHQLRKKLHNFYQTHDSDDEYRIVIPRGQYAIAAVDATDSSTRFLGINITKQNLNRGLFTALLVLLMANLLILLSNNNSLSDNRITNLAQSAIWQELVNDDLPILLVMGDYYIFGELNDNGNIGRMVRDFNINSREDLEERHFSDWETTHNYQDLDLSYMPEGSAYALTRVIPILSTSSKRLNITMMSDLTLADVRDNHIVYIGYISALDKLSDLVFAASEFQVGRSFDELVNLDNGRYYTSDAGLPEAGQQFRDYGFFSTFPASSENRVVIISGMRDAGLMHTAQAMSDSNSISALEQHMSVDTENNSTAIEVLYEVFGVDRMNFEGNLIYSNNLDSSLIWGRNILNP